MKTTKTTDQLVNEFLADRDVSESTRKVYRISLGIWFRWLSANQINHSSAGRSHAMNYKSHLISKHTPKSADNYLWAVKLYYKWLVSKQYYHTDITVGIKRVTRSVDYRKKYLNNNQVDELLSVIDRSTIKGKRDYAIILLMLTSGLRCIEVSRSNVGDIMSDSLVIQRKRRIDKDSVVFISEGAIEAIHEYLLTREDLTDDQPLFTSTAGKRRYTRMNPGSLSTIIRKYLNKAGMNDKKITAHSLRHTFASRLIMADVPLIEVSTLLGHQDVSTTQIYLRQAQQENIRNKYRGKTIDNIIGYKTV